jgi:hypothetical protein
MIGYRSGGNNSKLRNSKETTGQIPMVIQDKRKKDNALAIDDKLKIGTWNVCGICNNFW